MREGDHSRMQVALDETLERLVAVRSPFIPPPLPPPELHPAGVDFIVSFQQH
jgi:hypothetical protein